MTRDAWAARWGDMVPHLATLQRLASQAHNVLEFGTRGGVSTWALLDGLPADGHLTTVDVYGKWETPDRVRDDPRVTFIAGDDRHVALPDADLVFIDTSHKYEHTKVELRRAVECGAKVIACHDWNLPDVERAVREFCSESRWMIDFIEPSDWGLAVLR